jgi:hypothetical protein
MGTTILVGELHKSAVKLISALNLAKFEFTVAALMKDEDADDWFITLGIPGLRQKGAKQFLSIIYDIQDIAWEHVCQWDKIF